MGLPPCPCGAVAVRGDEGHAPDCPYPCYCTNPAQLAFWERERKRRTDRRLGNLSPNPVDTQSRVDYDTANPSPETTPVTTRRRKCVDLNPAGLFAQRCQACDAVLVTSCSGNALVCPECPQSDTGMVAPGDNPLLKAVTVDGEPTLFS